MNDKEEIAYQPQNNHGMSQDEFEEIQREMDMPKCHCCGGHYDDSYMVELNGNQYCEGCADDAESEFGWDLEGMIDVFSKAERDYVLELLNTDEGKKTIIEKLQTAIRKEVK
jgi:hypothetical protein